MTTRISLSQAYERMQRATPYELHSTLTIAGRDVTCSSLSLRRGESGQDSLELTASTPDTTLMEIDPRTKPDVTLAQYLSFADTDEETAPISVQLTLRELRRNTSAEADTVDILARGYESLLRDDNARIPRSFTSSSNAAAAILTLIRDVLPNAEITLALQLRAPFLDADDILNVTPSSNQWATLCQIVDGTATNSELFWDGNKFVGRIRPLLTSSPRYIFNTANTSVFTRTRARESFYNAIRIEAANGTVATVESKDGTLGVNTVGRRLYIETVPLGLSGAAATRRANALLSRALSSGDEASLETPDTPLGLAPGDTIAVVLDTKSVEYWLIANITITPGHGAALNLRKDIQ